MTKVKQIAKEIENFAPIFLKESYDNVGMMIGDKESEVKRVLLALDCTNDVIDEAIKENCDTILTHHPLFFMKPSSIVKGDLTGDKVIKIIKNDINLYSAHTNLDSALNGINKTIVEMLGFKSDMVIDKSGKEGYEDCGIGRLIRLDNPMKLNELIELIKVKLNIKNMRVVRGCDEIKSIAIINGSGQSYLGKAKDLGADCVITGDTTYHFVSDYKEMGMSIIDAGHFGTEYAVYLKVLEFLKDKFKDVEFIEARSSKDPYEFV